jgi:hypothetical protein
MCGRAIEAVRQRLGGLASSRVAPWRSIYLGRALTDMADTDPQTNSGFPDSITVEERLPKSVTPIFTLLYYGSISKESFLLNRLIINSKTLLIRYNILMRKIKIIILYIQRL